MKSGGWQTVRLGWVAETIVPQRDKPVDLSGPIPWLRIEDFNGKYLGTSKSGQGVTEAQVARMPLRVFPKNTVVCSCSCTMGATAIAANDLVTNQTFIGLVPDKAAIIPDFLFYVMQAMQERLQSQASGAIQQYLSRDEFRNLRFALPPLDEQRRIAEFLDDQVARIDEIVAARSAQRTLLAEEYSVVMRQLVAGDLDGSSKKRPSVPWIPRLGNEAREVPLCRIVTLQRGVDLTAEERQNGDIPVVTTAGVVGHHDVSIVRHSGVVIGRYGSVGNVHWVNGPHWPHNTTLYVRDYHHNYPRWVFYLLKSYPYEMLQARAAVPGINRNDMATDLMPWIPVEQQADVAKLLDDRSKALESGLEALIASEARLNELKRSLITAAVTGEFGVACANGSQVTV